MIMKMKAKPNVLIGYIPESKQMVYKPGKVEEDIEMFQFYLYISISSLLQYMNKIFKMNANNP